MRFTALFAALFAALALTTAHAADSGSPPVRPDAIRAHVEFLADDLLEGRAAASRGYDIAAAYVEAQFKQAGLTPAGDDGTYLQRVPLLEATAVLPGSSAEWVIKNRTRTFEYGVDYIPSADFESATSTLTAPLAFAGFGIDAPELNHNDFATLDLKGRIAVIFTGAPARFSNEQRAFYSSLSQKLTTLVAHGAVGVILVDSTEDAKHVPWDKRVAMSWQPQMRWLDADGKPHESFPQLKQRFRFSREAAAELFASAQVSFETASTAADNGESQAFELPGLLTLSATTGLRRTESTNVLAMIPGSDSALKNEYVIITAHLDHLGRGSAVNGDATFNGAQDNAVGVGILLEIARTLQHSGTKLKRSVLFAAVTAEEKGLLGSDYLAQQAKQRKQKIVAALNIDMPLPLAPSTDLIALGADNSTLGNLIRDAAGAEGYSLTDDPAPDEIRFVRSDQYSFIRLGIPSLVVICGIHARDRNVDLQALQESFLHDHYHQPSDDISVPLDYPSAASLARINLRVAAAVANATARPRWHRHDFFAQKFTNAQ
ncbi:MAG TPA: M28 family metallopeptidase [Steroidobacteraceae bacterium]|nr:M28 family metallopeptidase [Steroidobacteraceae bacterium]